MERPINYQLQNVRIYLHSFSQNYKERTIDSMLHTLWHDRMDNRFVVYSIQKRYDPSKYKRIWTISMIRTVRAFGQNALFLIHDEITML